MLTSGVGTADRRELKHSVRTLLNHIVGYGDILQQEALDSSEEGLGAVYKSISVFALQLRDLALVYFCEAGSEPEAERRAELERGIYGLLYDIIGLVQKAKRDIDTHSASAGRFLEDTARILEAANGIVELFESKLYTGADEAPAQDEAGSELPASLASVDFDLAPRCGRILIVDDNQFNRELLARHLERQGHVVCQASDGRLALEILCQASFDLLILDLMMPGLNGYQLLEKVKADGRLKDIHVIVISSLSDSQSIARCIQLGAEDFLPREFEPVILRARIESCLEKRFLKAKEELCLAAVRDSERHLRDGFLEGAAYVRGLLPERLDRPSLGTDWVFLPSLSLGGDVFGYHALDDTRYALYLLDVSGHGIGAALYSATLMNLLKTQALPSTDFGNPSSVIARLNGAFQMEEQNNLYFTAWYGVWNSETRELSFSSAGGPPALLFLPGGGVERLETEGTAVGVDEDSAYRTAIEKLPPGSVLYLYSDGAFEITLRDGDILGLDAFTGIVAGANARRGGALLPGLVETLRGLSASGRFEDDVSLVEFRLG
jgi:sigma-B regulation protein RsbU (phosphoserine phosphatase)